MIKGLTSSLSKLRRFSTQSTNCARRVDWSINNSKEKVKWDVGRYIRRLNGCSLMSKNENPVFRAKAVIQELRENEKQEPTKNILNVMLKVCISSKDFDEACSTFEQLKKLPSGPDHISYTTAVSGFAKLGRCEKALELFREGVLEFPKHLPLYVSALSAAEKNKDIRMATQIFEQSFRAGVQPNSMLYSTMLRALGRAQDWKTALHIFRHMKKNDIDGNLITWNNFLGCLIYCKDSRLLWRAWEDLQKSHAPDVISYTNFIRSLGNIGDAENILIVAKQARIQNVHLDEQFFTTILNELGKIDLETALKFANRVPRDKKKSVFHQSLCNLLYHDSRFTELDSVINYIVKNEIVNLRKVEGVDIDLHGLTLGVSVGNFP